jgi:hypothetical protein
MSHLCSASGRISGPLKHIQMVVMTRLCLKFLDVKEQWRENCAERKVEVRGLNILLVDLESER